MASNPQVIGIRRNATRVVQDSIRGTTISEVYIVGGARTWLDAMVAAPSTPVPPNPIVQLPAIGDSYPGLPAGFQLTKCLTREPAGIENSDGTWDIVITWGLPRYSLAPPDQQDVAWNFSLSSDRIDLSLDGKPIGSRYFYKTTSEGTLLRDDDAELGTTVEVPRVEISVRLPAPWLWNPATVLDDLGCVNQQVMTIDGFSFPARTTMLSAARAHRILPLSTTPLGTAAHEVEYTFVAALKKLPAGVPAYDDVNSTLWQGQTIPLAFGWYPRFKAKKADGTIAAVHEEIATREPLSLRVFRAYDDRRLDLLGVL